MNARITACIPSEAMREFLTVNHVDMSALQQVAIVSEYAERKDIVPLFELILRESNSEAEKMLLSSAIEDFRSGNDFYRDKTQEIYDKNFPHEGFPLYPFLEVCGLPVLFQQGDVIRAENKFYYVGFLPSLIIGRCDFSDECYLCYDLSYPVKTDDDLGLAHAHIHLCEAEKASQNELTHEQNNTYAIIRSLLSKYNEEGKLTNAGE